ncbi:hypothetical protein [Candidatus Nitrosocosmicus hydrocola]|uniref:hypothetical protein n=1 Tax=Candidatus Nitrosocosmicus hydrocola TaxID=1826872 RepID=UPI0011E5F45D|nr:hypothetical protein [Candidatus Nitrosocosmicus hydrocola]
MSSSSSSPSHSDDSTNPKRITTSVALSIVSGIIILASSLFWLFFVNTTTIDEMRGFMGNTMGDHMMNSDGIMNFHGFMGWMGGGGTGVTGDGWILPLMVIVSGIMILIGATIMYKRPREKKIGGIIVIIFSVLGLTGMGFSIIGSIIGIVGGTVALVEK